MNQYTAYIVSGEDVKIKESLSLNRVKKSVANYLLNNPADTVIFERSPYGARKVYDLNKISGEESKTTKRLYFAEWLMNTVTEVI